MHWVAGCCCEVHSDVVGYIEGMRHVCMYV